MEFAERLKKIRKEREMKAVDLARAMQLPKSSIAHFERGSRKPSFENLLKLADILEVSMDYLAGRIDTFFS